MNENKSWWSTMPGILTGLAGVITAITGLIIALGINKEGLSTNSFPEEVIVDTTSIIKKTTYTRWFCEHNICIEKTVDDNDLGFINKEGCQAKCLKTSETEKEPKTTNTELAKSNILEFQNFKNCRYIEETNSILKISGGDQWNAGCTSINFLPRDDEGSISLKITNPSQQYLIGLIEKGIKPTLKDIRYGLSVQQRGHEGLVQVNYVELGNTKQKFGAQEGDVLTISKDKDGKVSYYLNADLKLQSNLKSKNDLQAVILLKYPGSEVVNLAVTGNWL